MNNEQEKIKSKSYTLYDDGYWLGQIVITSDGMFSSVTDYGNLSYAWRHFGDDFRTFLININVDYFSGKLATGMSYIAYGPKINKACSRYSNKILPKLQEILKKEIENGEEF